MAHKLLQTPHGDLSIMNFRPETEDKTPYIADICVEKALENTKLQQYLAENGGKLIIDQNYMSYITDDSLAEMTLLGANYSFLKNTCCRDINRDFDIKIGASAGLPQKKEDRNFRPYQRTSNCILNLIQNLEYRLHLASDKPFLYINFPWWTQDKAEASFAVEMMREGINQLEITTDLSKTSDYKNKVHISHVTDYTKQLQNTLETQQSSTDRRSSAYSVVLKKNDDVVPLNAQDYSFSIGEYFDSKKVQDFINLNSVTQQNRRLFNMGGQAITRKDAQHQTEQKSAELLEALSYIKKTAPDEFEGLFEDTKPLNNSFKF